MIEVHPFAARFPMLSDEEIADLAEDIKANGLVHPIVLDKDGVLIDGRNRLAACTLAGVAPRFTTLNGHDPHRFILSCNIRRRHLTIGQRAMLVAIALTVSSRNFGDAQAAADEADIKKSRLSKAVTIAEYAPKLVDQIIAGELSLDEGYETARTNKTALDAAEEREAKQAADLARLLIEAPDLAQRIAEGTLQVAEGITLLEKRIRDHREACERTTRSFIDAVWRLRVMFARPAGDFFDEWAGHLDKAQEPEFLEYIWNPASLRLLATGFENLATEMVAREKGKHGQAEEANESV